MNLGELLDSLTVLCGCRDLTVARQLQTFFPDFIFSNTDLYEYIYKERDERISRTQRNYCSALKTGNWKIIPQKIFSTIYFNLTTEIKMQGGLYRMYAFIENVLPSDKECRAGIKRYLDSVEIQMESRPDRKRYSFFRAEACPEMEDLSVRVSWFLTAALLDGCNEGNDTAAGTLFSLKENREYWDLKHFLTDKKQKFQKMQKWLRRVILILSVADILTVFITIISPNYMRQMLCVVGAILLLLLHVLNYYICETAETLAIFDREYKNNAAVRACLHNQAFQTFSYTIVPYGLTAVHAISWYEKRQVGIISFVIHGVLFLTVSIILNNFPLFVGGMAALTLTTIIRDFVMEDKSFNSALVSQGKTMKDLVCEADEKEFSLSKDENENQELLKRVYSAEFARMKNISECILAFSLIVMAVFGLIAVSLNSSIAPYFHIRHQELFYLFEMFFGGFIVIMTLALLASENWFFGLLMNLAYESNYNDHLDFEKIRPDLETDNIRSLFREYRMVFKGPFHISRLAFARGVYDYCYFRIIHNRVPIEEIDISLRPKTFQRKIMRINRLIIAAVSIAVMILSFFWGTA